MKNGQIIATSGTPQYIANSIEGRTVTKCYRSENATLTVGEQTADGAQADVAELKTEAELYVADFIYDNLFFDEDVCKIIDGELYLKALLDYVEY